jgi:hypothetical protein
VVTICTTSLTFTDSTFCPHSVFLYVIWIWEQATIISLYSINWLVCITETECVYCSVRTESFFVCKVLACHEFRCHMALWWLFKYACAKQLHLSFHFRVLVKHSQSIVFDARCSVLSSTSVHTSQQTHCLWFIRTNRGERPTGSDVFMFSVP